MFDVKSFDRRKFLKTSALAATAATFGGLATRTMYGYPTVPTGYFDVNAGVTKLFGPHTLNGTYEWQSFGFDNNNNKLFYVQPTDNTGSGNLRLSYLNLNGTPNDGSYMDFTQFGHGMSIGIEPSGTDTFIWMETQGEISDFEGGAEYLGKRICRVKWATGSHGPFTYSDIGTSTLPDSVHYLMKTGSHENTCNICPLSQRLILRYGLDDDAGTPPCVGYTAPRHYYYSVYNLSDIKTDFGAATPIYDAIPEYEFLLAGTCQTDPTTNVVYHPAQGMAIYGEYGYILTGSAYKSPDNPVGSDGNVRMTCFKFSDKTFVQSNLILGGDTCLNPREPEGLAIQITDTDKRICLGLSGYDDNSITSSCGVHSHTPGWMSVYTKNSILTGAF